MKILHYNLGLPPYRSGGLTKYSLDLIKYQSQIGHDISLLYPGQINPITKNKIKENKSYGDIKVFELINPLPVSLTGGVKEPSLFMKKINDINFYKEFLIKEKPDIIHIHTLMGLHAEFIFLVKELNIPILFSSHDYFGICPKVNLLNSKGEICNSYQFGKECIACNLYSYSLPLIYFMQSHLYKNIKSTKIMEIIKKKKKKSFIIDENNKNEGDNDIDINLANQYVNLRKYYLDILNNIDLIHFNSTIAKEEFEKFIRVKSETIQISHSDIKDNRVIKSYDSKKRLKLGFMGPSDKYKGLPLLLDALKVLKKRGNMDWELNIYGSNTPPKDDSYGDNIHFYGSYNHNDLKEIFDNIDVLIIPSIWKETFGFIGLEAMSYGVPVLVSKNVGFKDLIINKKTGIIIDSEKQALANEIEFLLGNRQYLKSINENINNLDFKFDFIVHNEEILKFYSSLIEKNKLTKG